MRPARRPIVLLAAILLAACSQPAAQSNDPAELRKEIEALKRDIAEIRDFLKQATGGRFGGPRLEDASIDLAGAPVKGAAGAPVTLVEVSDYHCPYCRRHVQQTQPRIYSEYVDTGKVRHVFIHYPIDQLHPEAFRSHEAASCASDQGKFWELHVKLFETPARTVDQIAELATAAGLDAAALRACIDSGKYSKPVRESVTRMQTLGVDSTPMFLIGQTPKSGQPLKVLKVIRGAHAFEQFKALIDPMLTGKP